MYRALPQLRELREQGPEPLTLRQLSARVHVDPAHLSRIELGLRNARPAVALAIAHALGADRGDLFVPVVTSPQPTTPKETHAQAE